MKIKILNEYFKNSGINTEVYHYMYSSPNLEIEVYNDELFVGVFSVFSEDEVNSWGNQVKDSILEDIKLSIPEMIVPYVDFEQFSNDYRAHIDIWDKYGKLRSTFKYDNKLYFIIDLNIFEDETQTVEKKDFLSAELEDDED